MTHRIAASPVSVTARKNGQGGSVAVCYRECLQIQQLHVPTPQEMEAMFFRLLFTDKSAVLFSALDSDSVDRLPDRDNAKTRV